MVSSYKRLLQTVEHFHSAKIKFANNYSPATSFDESDSRHQESYILDSNMIIKKNHRISIFLFTGGNVIDSSILSLKDIHPYNFKY